MCLSLLDYIINIKLIKDVRNILTSEWISSYPAYILLLFSFFTFLIPRALTAINCRKMTENDIIGGVFLDNLKKTTKKKMFN